MDTNPLLDVLSTQSAIGRTGKGWDIGEGMLGASSTSADNSSKDGFVARECLNCGIVLSGEFFASGCPNCGCKDVKDFGDKVRRPVAAVLEANFKIGIMERPVNRQFYVVGASRKEAIEDPKGEQQCHRKQ